MDWSKVGQAFSNAANVYGQGLMEQYQRQKDREDWQNKALWQKEHITDPTRTAEADLDEKVRHEAAIRQTFENDVKMFPELGADVEGHIKGDPEATKRLQIYMGARHKMTQNSPLSSDQIAELSALSPSIRHGILQGHLRSLNAEQERKLDMDIKTAQKEYYEAGKTERLASAARQGRDGEDESNLYTYNADKADEKKATKTLENDIKALRLKLQSANTGKARAIDLGNVATAATYDTNAAEIQGLIDEKEAELASLTGQTSSAEAARARWAETSPLKTTPQMDAFMAELPLEDQKEMARLRGGKPGLSDDAYIALYYEWKRRVGAADEERRRTSANAAARVGATAMRGGMGR